MICSLHRLWQFRCMKKDGKFELNSTGLLTYSHGEYFGLGKELGRFGFSVKKR